MLTQAKLKKFLHYNPETGVFTKRTWVDNRGRMWGGKRAGGVNTCGYITIGIDGKRFLAHRLAFIYMEGYFPEHVVDHINGVKHDNRFNNLRHVTQLCNMQNQKISSRNTSGFTGVSRTTAKKDAWAACKMVDGSSIYLGSFSDIVSAALALCEFEKCCKEVKCNSIGNNFVKLRNLGYNI